MLQQQIESLKQELMLSMEKLNVLCFPVTEAEKITSKALGTSSIVATNTHTSI